MAHRLRRPGGTGSGVDAPARAPSTERRRADWNPRDSLSEGSAGGRIDPRVLARLLSPLHRCGRQLLVRCPQIALARLLVSAGTDAVVVDDLPEALVALSLSP